jgi:hypothetical protein
MLSKRFVGWFELRTLTYYKKYGRHKGRVLDLLRELRRGSSYGSVLFSPHEAWNIYSIAHAWRNHGGLYAEVGVYRGASAELICHAKLPETKLLLFDTFAGLPAPGKLDPRFEEGMFPASEEEVRQRLKRFPNWETFKGLFPDTAGPAEDCRFSFVHLDMDLYEGTVAALEFFWPRLLPGGVILSHDYSQCEGVAKAFEWFFHGRKDYKLVELSVTQVMVIKS